MDQAIIGFFIILAFYVCPPLIVLVPVVAALALALCVGYGAIHVAGCAAHAVYSVPACKAVLDVIGLVLKWVLRTAFVVLAGFFAFSAYQSSPGAVLVALAEIAFFAALLASLYWVGRLNPARFSRICCSLHLFWRG